MKRKLIRKRKLRSLLALMLILSMMLGMVQTVQAADYQPNRKGSITITLKDQGTELKDVELLLYKVGSLGGGNYINFTLVPALAATGLDLNNLTTAEAAIAAANTLAGAVGNSGITPLFAKTDSKGVAAFPDLEQGMYLMVQSGTHAYGIVSPLLVAIPYMEDGVNWIYDVSASPKASLTPQEDGRIEVTKRVSWLNEDADMVDINVTDATYYVGLFYDEQGNIPYSTDYVKPIRITGASRGTAVFEGLPAGTYYVLETDASGKVVPLEVEQRDSDGNRWICIVGNGEETETNRVVLDMPGTSAGSVVLNNVYIDLPDDYMINARIFITKKVIKDGSQATVNDTFHAGIFRVESNGDEEWIETVTLKQNGTVEVEVPLGGEDGRGDITYVVRETDKDGDPIDKDTFAYEVTGEKEVTLTEDNTEGRVEITNTAKSATPTPTPTPTPTTRPTTPTSSGTTSTVRTSNTTSSSSGKASVKTGDETPIELWIGLLGIAALAIVGAGAFKRKKRSK